jgi:hypothetical protein
VNWLDVSGSPGSGKSTLCDAFWHPHAFVPENRLPPQEWLDWLNECTRLFHLIKPHATFGAALRMVNRSVRKMATVSRMEGQGPYIQTGLVQRGLGFGWRLNDMGKDLNELRHYFELMPVSIGVAVTRCPPEIVAQRNRDREKVAATAHENRSHMIPLMAPAIEIAIEVLRARGVSVLEVDTTQPVEAARAQLIAFAAKRVGELPADYAHPITGHFPKMGSSYQDSVFSSPPWWQ